MTPVMFAFGGWQTSSFIAGEMRDPRRDLARGMLIGVGGVILLYMAVNFVYLYVLGPEELARTTTPASAVMRVGSGRARRGADRSRHRHLDARLSESGNVDLAARLLRHGGGSALLQGRGASERAHARARRGDCAARRARHHHRAVGPLRADSEHSGLGGLRLVWTDGGLALRLPPPRRRDDGSQRRLARARGTL